MNVSPPAEWSLLALTGRHPADSIVQATLVQQLQVIGVGAEQVHVLHAVPRQVQTEWFVSVERCNGGSWGRRHAKLLYALVRRLRATPPTVLYCREVVTLQLALVARTLARRPVPLIFDCRGDVVAEAQLGGTTGLRLSLLRLMQDRAWGRVDRVMTVSDRLAHRIRSSRAGRDVAVVPNLQSRVLEAVERQGPGPLVVFAGGAQPWQNAEGVLDYLSALSRFRIGVEIITNDDGLRQRAQSAGFAVSSGDRAHVMDRLQRATGSWMVRADTPANAVASPVKLGEALSAGTFIIGSVSTWEYMDRLVEDELAMLVSGMDDLPELAERLHAVWREGSRGRDRRLATVQNRWLLQAHADTLRSFFGLEGSE